MSEVQSVSVNGIAILRQSSPFGSAKDPICTEFMKRYRPEFFKTGQLTGTDKITKGLSGLPIVAVFYFIALETERNIPFVKTAQLTGITKIFSIAELS